MSTTKALQVLTLFKYELMAWTGRPFLRELKYLSDEKPGYMLIRIRNIKFMKAYGINFDDAY